MRLTSPVSYVPRASAFTLTTATRSCRPRSVTRNSRRFPTCSSSAPKRPRRERSRSATRARATSARGPWRTFSRICTKKSIPVFLEMVAGNFRTIGGNHAKVHYRARNFGGGEAFSARLERGFAEIVQCAAKPRAADPVGRELCDRRQNLLRLYRAKRRNDSGACPAGRFPRKSRLRGPPHDRSHHC